MQKIKDIEGMNSCIFCKTCDYKSLYKKKFLSEIYNIVKCKNCGLVYLIPRPAEDKIKRLYDSDYFQGKGFDRTVDYLKEYSAGDAAEYRRMLDLIGRYKNGGRLLDIGCGMGAFLDIALKGGWDVYGLEVSEYAAGLLKKRFRDNIINSSIKDGLFKNNYFDAINMMEVVEHLIDPIGDLKIIRKYLKQEGVLIVQTGNIESFPAKIKNKNWNYILVPGHVFYFSTKTIKMLLEAAGFKIVRILPPNDRENSRLFKIADGFFKNECYLKKKVLYFFEQFISFKEKLFSDGLIVIAKIDKGLGG